MIAVALLAASTGFGSIGLSNAVLAQSDPDQPLLQPGEAPSGTASDQPIHLHMPTAEPHRQFPPKRARHAASKPASAAADVAESAPAETRAARHKHSTAGLAAVPSPAGAPIPFSFGDDLSAPPAAPIPGPPAAGKALSSRQSSGEPVKADVGDRAHLTKHGAVLFDKGASDPSPAQYTGVKVLAGDLSSALQAGTARVQLEAYGGAPGDKSSDARRLSLKRALAVRQLLIDDGLPSSRIDVRAMGGIDDKGPADRVDVFVRAG
jgi:outer membrane protein OmpA-like peptidoglycan-associated protein